jgi:hypothetical protein
MEDEVVWVVAGPRLVLVTVEVSCSGGFPSGCSRDGGELRGGGPCIVVGMGGVVVACVRWWLWARSPFFCHHCTGSV